MTRRNKLHRRRGVFFITVLFTTVILAMLVGAAMESGMWGLKRGQNVGDSAAARRAAASGVEYVLTRLREDPTWKANTTKTLTINEPGLFVVEEYGNVVGVLSNNGQNSQFRVRFNFNDGASGADGMPNPPSLDIDSTLVSVNNMVPNAVANIPLADGPSHSVPATPNIYTTIPGHSVFIYAEGRCGDWLQTATVANPNPTAPSQGGFSLASVETVYKVANANSGGTPAVGAAAGNLLATMGTSAKGDALTLDSASGTVVGRLRSRNTLTVAGGKSGEYNLVPAKKGAGEYRSLSTASVNADPTIVQKAEAASDTLYPIPWSQVHQAGTANTLAAGTYVVWDDGSLHYFDMNVAQYSNFMSIPANQSNPGLTVNLPSTVTIDSKHSGSSLDATITISGDTLVTGATNTTDLAILPQKGAASGPGMGGGAPSASDMSTAINAGTSMLTQQTWNMPASSQFTVTNPSGYQFLDSVAQWSASQGVGTYSAGNWNLATGGALNNLGSASAVGNIDVVGLATLTAQISLYVAANPNDTNWTSFATAMSMPASTSMNEIPGVPSQATTENLEVKFSPANSSGATLTAPGNVTIGSKLSGNGASITAQGNLNLVGLGVNLSAYSNPTQGVSLYSKKDVNISTYVKSTGKYKDISLKGVVYAWGNFKAFMGHSSIAESNWGHLKLTGSMVAYGKDPSDLVSPTTGGDIQVVAKDATMKYDPAYLLDFSNVLPANVSVIRVRWAEK